MLNAPIDGLTKRKCLKIWSRFEDGGNDRMHFMTNARGFMSFDRLQDFLNPTHADPKFPVP